MQDMDQGLVNCPDLCLPEDLSEYMDDMIVDPDILLSLPTCEAEVESYCGVPASTDCLHEGSPENTTSTKHCLRKRPRRECVCTTKLDYHLLNPNQSFFPILDNGDAHVTSRPKRQRESQAQDPGSSPGEVFSPPSPEIPVQPPSPSLPHPPTCIIAIHKSGKTQTVQTLQIPSLIRLSRTAPIILVPVTRHYKCQTPPLSPVNVAAVPVQPSSSPSGSLSDIPPVCSSPQSPEESPVKESPIFPARDIPQSVKDYIQEAKAYISQACDDLGDGLSVTSNYVNIKVLQRDNVRSGKNRNQSLDKELEVMGETERKKHMVALEQIFEGRQGSRSKSYNLLVGKAGMGKSTCIKKLCLDWSKDCTPQFDFVFLLDRRLLTVTEPTHSLQTLLLTLSSFAPPCSDPDAVFAQILASPKRVLIIFDGFDHLRDFELLVQHLEKDTAACLQKDKKANTFTVRQLYSAILLRVVLPGCCLLLASRPRGSACLLLRKVDNVLEVSGFSPSEVETYINCCCSDPEVQNSAINFLQKCSYLKRLCWNPGVCRLVCLILQRQPSLDTLPRTLTGICNHVLRMKLESTCNKGEETQSKQPVEEEDMCNAVQTRSKVCARQRASRKTHRKRSDADVGETGVLSDLSCLAWETVKSNSSKISSEFSVSSKTKEAGLRTGLLSATLVGRRESLSNAEKDKDTIEEKYTTRDSSIQSEGVCGNEFLSWANPFLQSYLAAVHLSLSSAGLIKTLPFQTASKGLRRSQREEFELTQRFAVGLLYQKEPELLWLRPKDNKDFYNTVISKQNALMDHLRYVPFGLLRSCHILDLCHFVCEGSFTHCESTKDSGSSQLAAHLVDNLPEELTLNRVPLSPADVYAIKNIVEHKGEKKRRFSLDIQDSGIQVFGLRSLVGLNAISSYRACVSDVIALWEDLEKQKEDCRLHNAVSKFKIDPFKATQMSHIEHLARLVDIHTNKRLSESQSNSIFAEGVPAIKNLHKLEIELDPEKGPVALLMLWEMLPGLHNLQHLDLENNRISDDGAQHLAKALVSLSSLETLNLSQNSIGDHGAKTLAVALTNLTRLDRLSLHSNVISDEGACNLAAVLPHMESLSELDIRCNNLTDVGVQSLGSSLKKCRHMKSLRMWNKYIPGGVLERLRQQDHRITDDK